MLEAAYIDKVFKEILLLGPSAAMYSREIEQILIQNHMPDLVSEADLTFQSNRDERVLRNCLYEL